MHLVNPLRFIGLAFLMLIVPAAVATAASDGFALSWGNTCWGETGSTSYLTWACNSNTNENIRITCSFKMGQPVSDFVAAAVYLAGYSESLSIPDWWRLGEIGTGDCRTGALSVFTDGSVLANAGNDVCMDPWNGAGGGGLGQFTWHDNRMYIGAIWALPDPIAIEANTEYFALQLRINAGKTVGGCAGCDVPVLWVLNRIEYDTLNAAHYIDEPYAGARPCLWWQRASQGCYIVPARNSTWGQIKSLYR